MTVTIFHDPDCATSRNVLALIRNSGEEPRVVEYLKAPPSRAEFAELLRRMDIPLRAVLRRMGRPTTSSVSRSARARRSIRSGSGRAAAISAASDRPRRGGRRRSLPAFHQR